MISEEDALQLIVDSIASLQRAGLIEANLMITCDTVLLGSGSRLDSIAFVTFVTDLEERLNRMTGQELYLVLTDIHEFNAETAYLSATMLARFIAHLTQSRTASS
jgi:hypothetical protein